MDPLLAHFQDLFAYDLRCTPLINDSLTRSRESVERAGLAALAAPFQRSVEIWAHVQAARRIWLLRLGRKLAPPADGLFPVWSFDNTLAQAAEMDAAWNDYITNLDPAELTRTNRYTSTEGKAYDSKVTDILTHVVNHSSYHRGQIASLIASTGTNPAITDFIFFKRQPIQ